VTLGAVLQFRQALTQLRRRYAFSAAFGPSDTRESCIDSAQDVYDRLLDRDVDGEEDLNFDVLAVLAVGSKGLNEYKLKEMIKVICHEALVVVNPEARDPSHVVLVLYPCCLDDSARLRSFLAPDLSGLIVYDPARLTRAPTLPAKVFRPDRDGRLTRLAFVKSIDSVYKRLVMLTANINNSSQIDIAIENIVSTGIWDFSQNNKTCKSHRLTFSLSFLIFQFNVGFYFAIFCLILIVMGQNPMTIFISLATFVASLAFMVGSTSAQYFEVSGRALTSITMNEQSVVVAILPAGAKI